MAGFPVDSACRARPGRSRLRQGPKNKNGPHLPSGRAPDRDRGRFARQSASLPGVAGSEKVWERRQRRDMDGLLALTSFAGMDFSRLANFTSLLVLPFADED